MIILNLGIAELHVGKESNAKKFVAAAKDAFDRGRAYVIPTKVKEDNFMDKSRFSLLDRVVWTDGTILDEIIFVEPAQDAMMPVSPRHMREASPVEEKCKSSKHFSVFCEMR